MGERTFETNEITKLMNVMIGGTEPYADSAIDEKIDSNLRTLIDVINWCLDGMYDAARYRKSEYRSARDIGERAYASLLQWKDWITAVEEELA